MPLTTISAGFTAAKQIKDLLIGMKSMSDEVKINEVILDAQNHLLTMQNALFEAQQSVNDITKEKTDLEAQITKMEDWDQQKELYKNFHPKKGLTLYALKEECVNGAQPIRMYCPNCFAKRKESILQKHNNNSQQIKCFKCDLKVDIGEDFSPGIIAISGD